MNEVRLFNFNTSNGQSIFVNSHQLRRDVTGWATMTAAYQEAFETICQQLINRKDKSFHPIDFVIYPTLFLFRHCCELNFKELLIYSENLIDTPKKKFKNHNLDSVWRDCKSALIQINDQYDFNSIMPYFDFKDAISYIDNLVSQITTFDRNSESFRYPVSIDGDPLLEDLYSIDIKQLYNHGKNLFSELQALHLAILMFDRKNLTDHNKPAAASRV